MSALLTTIETSCAELDSAFDEKYASGAKNPCWPTVSFWALNPSFRVANLRIRLRLTGARNAVDRSLKLTHFYKVVRTSWKKLFFSHSV
jgi:hypothetical protein